MKQWARSPEVRDQMVLFAERLDEAIPPNHSVRLLDAILERPDWGHGRSIYHEQHEAARVEHARRMATPEAKGKYARRHHPGERPDRRSLNETAATSPMPGGSGLCRAIED